MTINLSDSEWKLMNHLWAESPRTITEPVSYTHLTLPTTERV